MSPRIKAKIVARIRPTKEAAYTANWKSVSLAIKKRDGNRCYECKAPGPGLEVHHVIPVSKGGKTISFNLRTLCRNCHSRKHSHMR